MVLRMLKVHHRPTDTNEEPLFLRAYSDYNLELIYLILTHSLKHTPVQLFLQVFKRQQAGFKYVPLKFHDDYFNSN